MTTRSATSFRAHTFVVLTLGLSALGTAVTGIAAHVRDEPGALLSAHVALGILAIVFGARHVVFHHRALVAQVRTRPRGRVRSELLLAATVVAAVVVLAVVAG